MEVQNLHPDSIEIMPMDVTDLDNLNAQLQASITKIGGLDVLVISSGTGELNPDLDFGLEQSTISTNVEAFTFMANFAYRFFRNEVFGHLVGISSIAGLRGTGIAPAYNASKAYQINYLEGLRQKAVKGKRNITITDSRPRFVKTTMAKGDG